MGMKLAYTEAQTAIYNLLHDQYSIDATPVPVLAVIPKTPPEYYYHIEPVGQNDAQTIKDAFMGRLVFDVESVHKPDTPEGVQYSLANLYAMANFVTETIRELGQGIDIGASFNVISISVRVEPIVKRFDGNTLYQILPIQLTLNLEQL